MDLASMMAQGKAGKGILAPGASGFAALDGMMAGMAGRGGAGGMAGLGAQLAAGMNMANEMQKSQSYTTVQQVMDAFMRGEGAATMRLMQFPADVYLDGLPYICETLCRYDPRIAVPGKSVLGALLGGNGMGMFFTKWMQISQQNPHLVKHYAPMMAELIDWWADLLAATEGNCAGIGEAAQQMMSSWNTVLMSDPSLGPVILPCVLKSLTSKHNGLTQLASGIVNMINMSNKNLVAEKIDVLLEVLDTGVPDMTATTLLSAVYTAYDRNRDAVHPYVDTIAEYAVTGSMARIGGAQLLSKIAKRAPRLMYGFVDQLIPLLDDQRSASMTLMALADLSARNAILVRPYVRQITLISEEGNGLVFYGAPILGRIGRIDPDAARECQGVLGGWLRDDIDPQATSTILQEVKNVGGVYKDSLAPFMDVIRPLASYGDSKISDVAKDIIRYFDGTSLYLAEAFLSNQEDIFGRVLKAVDQMVDAKTSGLKKSVEELSRRADHQEQLLTAQREEVALLATDVGRIGDRVNVVEIAARALETRVEAVEVSMDELRSSVENQTSAMKAFIADVVKKLPVPSSFESSGRIRKRVILTFKCSRGCAPDFVYETAAWSKWLRVGLCAMTTAKSVLSADIMGALDSFSDLFDALKRKDIDAELTFKTLVDEPFLTSSEQDELIENLREKGFFKAFEYDADNATWYRKEARDLPPVAESKAAAPAASAQGKNPAAGAKPADTKSTTSMSAAAAKPAASKTAAAASGARSTPAMAGAAKTTAASTARTTAGAGKADFGCWMVKVGQLMPSKKRRWFALTGHMITYYEDDSLAVRKGAFSVRQIVDISNLDADNWFVITTPASVHNGSYRVQVENEADYSAFIGAVRSAQQA